MKREIKLRCWSPDNKEMYYPDENYYFAVHNTSIGYYPHNSFENLSFFSTNPSSEELKIEVMQFTGLKDKNGTDVYEGDYDKDYQVVTWCEKRNGWAWSVYDFPTKDFILCHCYSCEGDYDFDEAAFEIIGNIYENPEILTP